MSLFVTLALSSCAYHRSAELRRAYIRCLSPLIALLTWTRDLMVYEYIFGSHSAHRVCNTEIHSFFGLVYDDPRRAPSNLPYLYHLMPRPLDGHRAYFHMDGSTSGIRNLHGLSPRVPTLCLLFPTISHAHCQKSFVVANVRIDTRGNRHCLTLPPTNIPCTRVLNLLS
jgi:hypothetical protein